MKHNTLSDFFESTSTFKSVETKTIYLDVDMYNKLKNIISDYPDHNLNLSKLASSIINDWMQENKEELLRNLYQKFQNRY